MNAEQSNLKAAFWMSGWFVLMLTMMVAGREVAREMDVFQLLLIRSVLGLAMLSPLIWFAGGIKAVATTKPLAHIGRNIAHYAAQYLWFVALTLIPLAQLISIEFTMPIWTAILAAIFLGERLTMRRVGSVALGLAGVVLIVRPLGGDIEFGQVIALAAAVGFAISLIMVKSLTRTESALTIMVWMLAIQTVLGAVPGLMAWQWPRSETWPLLVIIAFCGTFSHYCMARAMAHADATVVVPMDFLRVPLSALIGWLVYSELLDLYMVLGAALILLGNALNMTRSAAPRDPQRR